MGTDVVSSGSESFALRLSIAGNLGIGIVGLVFAVLTGSQAILLDGLFNWVFFVMGLLTLRVARLVQEPDSATYQFGHAAFEPLINTVKGLLILSVSVLALIPAVLALFRGGREMDAGFGVIYAVFAMLVCFALAITQRRLASRVASPLVETDAKNWLVNGMISSAVGLVFAVVIVLRGSKWQHLVPYVDPVLVVVMVCVTLGVPWKMVRSGIGELLHVAPDPELQQRVRAQVRPALEGLEISGAYLRMVKIGRWFSVVIHVVLPATFRLQRIAELDAVRARVATALEGIHPNLVVDTVFTEDGRWATGPGSSAEQVEHLRLDRKTPMDPA